MAASTAATEIVFAGAAEVLIGALGVTGPEECIVFAGALAVATVADLVIGFVSTFGSTFGSDFFSVLTGVEAMVGSGGATGFVDVAGAGIGMAD